VHQCNGNSSEIHACVVAALARRGREPHRLLQLLVDVQATFNFLPAAALEQLAEALGLPLARVRGTAGFYAFLSTEPRGQYRVLFSDNITDRMQGSEALLDRLCHELWVEPGRTSEDGLLSVATTSCTGLCDQGPGMLVNGRAIARLDAVRVGEIGQLIRERRPLAAWPAALFRIDDNIRRAEWLLGPCPDPGAAIRAALPHAGSDGSPALIGEIDRAGLRGRGGAGFAVAAKWEACRSAAGSTRYVVCNADEGEPGTFKDRVLLSSRADLVFDGMTVAAIATGATRGMLYLRGEYAFLRDALEQVLQRRRRDGLLGAGICGSRVDFDIEIHLGAGAYVCGEETALLESLEGKRGVPRNRPPYPVTHGYLQQPTIVNNVETLCAAALVALAGAARYRSLGTARSPGTKLLAVAGDCARAGVYEFPFGVTVQQVLEECGAPGAQAVQVGGPSGTCIDASEFGRRIAFEDLACAGAFTVFGPGRDLFEVARNYTRFFAHESCGFCTPCRVGTSMLAHIMDKIHAGNGSQNELAEMERLNRVLLKSAHCGLGHTACNPVLDTLKRFRTSYLRRLGSHTYTPAFDLDGALAAARRATGRDDPDAHLENPP
jgi:[NiFe] hydrogenase diaphorase moiety large subunit